MELRFVFIDCILSCVLIKGWSEGVAVVQCFTNM